MYRVYADKMLIYSPDLVDDGYDIVDPELEKELGKSGTFTFKILPDNKFYESIRPYKTIISIEKDDDEIWRGRVLMTERNIDNIMTVTCEGLLSFFLDTRVLPTHIYDTGSQMKNMEQRLRDLIDMHNYQLQFFNSDDQSVEKDTSKLFRIGQITVPDPLGEVDWGDGNYEIIRDELESLAETYGGYFVARHDQNGIDEFQNVLDFIYDPEVYSDQKIVLGENLLDFTETVNPENIFTAIIPVGYDADGNKIDVSEVMPDHKFFVYDAEAVNKYGLIIESITYSGDIKDPFDLYRLAVMNLNSVLMNVSSLELNAMDANVLGLSTENIDVGSMVQVNSSTHKLDIYTMCSKLRLHLTKPENNEYIFGNPPKDLSDIIIGNDVNQVASLYIQDLEFDLNVDYLPVGSYAKMNFWLETDGPTIVYISGKHSGDEIIREYTRYIPKTIWGEPCDVDDPTIGDSNFSILEDNRDDDYDLEEHTIHIRIHGKVLQFRLRNESEQYQMRMRMEEGTALPVSCLQKGKVMFGESRITSIPRSLFDRVAHRDITYKTTAMFKDCDSLTTAPEYLFGTDSKAHRLTDVSEMFSGCVNLTYVPELWKINPNIPNHTDYAKGCTNAENRDAIPSDWGGSGNEFKFVVRVPYTSSTDKYNTYFAIRIRTEGSTKIDWGDGSVSEFQNGINSNKTTQEVRSLYEDNDLTRHYYRSPSYGSQPYMRVVTITGAITYLDFGSSYRYGTNGNQLPSGVIQESYNSRLVIDVLTPLLPSMVQSLEYPDSGFSLRHTWIYNIPSNLFSLCKKLTQIQVDAVFQSLLVSTSGQTQRTIPLDLFDGLNIRSCIRTFEWASSSKTSAIPPLWNSGYTIPYHSSYARNCDLAPNYSEIPDGWK